MIGSPARAATFPAARPATRCGCGGSPQPHRAYDSPARAGPRLGGLSRSSEARRRAEEREAATARAGGGGHVSVGCTPKVLPTRPRVHAVRVAPLTLGCRRVGSRTARSRSRGELPEALDEVEPVLQAA